MKLSNNIILYGNTNISESLTQKDNELFKYIKKLELIRQPIQLDILKDNIGDYWLIRVDGLEGKKVKFTIPSFIHGIVQPLQFTEQTANGIPTQVEVDKLEERFDDTHWKKDDILYCQFGQHRFLMYNNPFGELTIVGNGNTLFGSAIDLFSEINTKELKFIHFDIQRLTRLDYMFRGQCINSLDLRGIKFGGILSIEQMFRRQLVDGTIDLTSLDLQRCETFKNCFHSCFDTKHIILPKTKMKVKTDMSRMLYMCVNLEAVEMQNIFQDHQILLERGIIERCDKLKEIDLSTLIKLERPWLTLVQCKNLKQVKLNSQSLQKEGLKDKERISEYIRAIQHSQEVQVDLI